MRGEEDFSRLVPDAKLAIGPVKEKKGKQRVDNGESLFKCNYNKRKPLLIARSKKAPLF